MFVSCTYQRCIHLDKNMKLYNHTAAIEMKLLFVRDILAGEYLLFNLCRVLTESSLHVCTKPLTIIIELNELIFIPVCCQPHLTSQSMDSTYQWLVPYHLHTHCNLVHLSLTIEKVKFTVIN